MDQPAELSKGTLVSRNGARNATQKMEAFHMAPIHRPTSSYASERNNDGHQRPVHIPCWSLSHTTNQYTVGYLSDIV